MPENGTKISIRLSDEYRQKLDFLQKHGMVIGMPEDTNTSDTIRALIDIGFGIMKKELEWKAPQPGAD